MPIDHLPPSINRDITPSHRKSLDIPHYHHVFLWFHLYSVEQVREPVPQGVQVPICFCGSLCKLMESKVLGNDFGMRFFMCDNYKYDPTKRYGKDK